ncbi:MAG: EamA family transporter [Woeseiaceae bacterium]|nr:EamA family transporter [Woeseiaceae bacterium]
MSNPRVRLYVGAALISLSPVWVKLVEVSPTTSGFYRAAIGGVAMVIYLGVMRKSLKLPRWVFGMLVVASVFFALDLWFWHRSINYIGPGLSTLLANFQVFIMMAVGIVVLKQPPRPAQLIAVPLALLGLALIVGLDWGSLPDDYRLGVIFGLLTAVSYAGYLLSMRQLRTSATDSMPTREIAIMSLLVAAFLGVSAIAEGDSLVIGTWTDVGWLLGYGLLSHTLGMMLIASSLPKVSTTEAGLALLLQPTLSFVWDVVFFARPMTPTELVGASIALVAIWLGSRPVRQTSR